MDLIPVLKDSLVDNILLTSGELAEVGIDTILKEEWLKNIPILGSLIGICKIGVNLKERNLLKQTAIFLKEFHNGDLSKDAYIAYKSTIENNSKKCEEELSRILLLLDSFLNSEKSKMLAKAYKSYIKRNIDWDTFIKYTEIINIIFVDEIEIINKFYTEKIIEVKKYQLQRLESFGFIFKDSQTADYFDNTEFSICRPQIILKNDFGMNFYEYTIK